MITTDLDEDEMDPSERVEACECERTLLVAFLAHDYPDALSHYFVTRGWITVH
jgi:hypothetical protein